MEGAFDLDNPLTGILEHQSDTVPALFASESDHMPSFKSYDYEASIRHEAISSILHAQFTCNLDPFVPYLATTYLDRFIARHALPKGKQWILKLLSISCLSLAAKMKKSTFSLNDFQGEEQFIFDSQTIQRTELLVLSVLKWRMRSITPFSFLHFFLSLLNLKDPILLETLKARATDILFKAQNEIRVLEFKPSIISASALLRSSLELFPLQFSSFQNTISSCVYVNKEKLLDCCKVMEDLLMSGYDSTMSSSTAINVLDRHWSSSESEKTTQEEEQRDLKRRKTTATTTFQFPQNGSKYCSVLSGRKEGLI